MSTAINQDEINGILWKACDTFRGTIDPSEYKNYILPRLRGGHQPELSAPRRPRPHHRRLHRPPDRRALRLPCRRAAIAANDYNLNIRRYGDTFQPEDAVDLRAVQSEIDALETRLTDVKALMASYLRELGLE